MTNKPSEGTTPQAERLTTNVRRSGDGTTHARRCSDCGAAWRIYQKEVHYENCLRVQPERHAVAPVETPDIEAIKRVATGELDRGTPEERLAYIAETCDILLEQFKVAPVQTRLTAEQFWPEWKLKTSLGRHYEWLSPAGACDFAEAFRDKSEATEIAKLNNELVDLIVTEKELRKEIKRLSTKLTDAENAWKISDAAHDLTCDKVAGLREEIERLQSGEWAKLKIRECEELRAKLARYEALEAHLPPGFAIGDDATAELAIKLVAAEAEAAALREAGHKAANSLRNFFITSRTEAKRDYADAALSVLAEALSAAPEL